MGEGVWLFVRRVWQAGRSGYAAVILAALLLSTRPVQAHPMLVESDPPPGAILETAPAEISITFSEPLGANSNFLLYVDSFQQLPGVEGLVDELAPERMRTALPPLAPDTYTVRWTVFGADGHAVRGSYTFAIVESEAEGVVVGLRQWPWGAVLVILLLAAVGLWRYRQRIESG